MSTVVSTTSAPAAVGPYSQAVSTGGAGGTVYVSGQVPLDPATGALVDGGIQAQAERVLTNIGEILGAAGLGYADEGQGGIIAIPLRSGVAVAPHSRLLVHTTPQAPTAPVAGSADPTTSCDERNMPLTPREYCAVNGLFSHHEPRPTR